jgi:hypothetical protein
MTKLRSLCVRPWSGYRPMPESGSARLDSRDWTRNCLVHTPQRKTNTITANPSRRCEQPLLMADMFQSQFTVFAGRPRARAGGSGRSRRPALSPTGRQSYCKLTSMSESSKRVCSPFFATRRPPRKSKVSASCFSQSDSCVGMRMISRKSFPKRHSFSFRLLSPREPFSAGGCGGTRRLAAGRTLGARRQRTPKLSAAVAQYGLPSLCAIRRLPSTVTTARSSSG